MSKNITKIRYNNESINIADPLNSVFYDMITKSSGIRLEDGGRYNNFPSGAFNNLRGLEYVNMPNCVTIGLNAFTYATLKSARFENCLRICSGAFSRCFSLSQLYLPNCQHIDANAFESAGIKELSLPNCLTLGTSAFMRLSQLERCYMPNCLSLPLATFSGCSKLQEVDLLNCECMAAFTFQGCSNLVSINLPNLLSLSSGGQFADCFNLKNVNLPKLSSMTSVAFNRCSALESLTFDSLLFAGQIATSCQNLKEIKFMSPYIYFSGSVATNCPALSKVVINADNQAILQISSAFLSTPIRDSSYLGYYGSVYVPSRLVDLYKSSTNWVLFSDRITSIENLPD